MKRANFSTLTVFSLSLFLILGSLTFSQAFADVSNPRVSAKNQANTELIDINSASLKELRSLPGVGKTYAKRIVENRPYTSVEDLRTKKVLPKGTFGKIEGKVVAKSR